MDVIYRTVIWKKPDNVNTTVDRSTFDNNQNNAKSDFEGDHKSDVQTINRLMQFDVETDYDTFKSKIDGQTVTWSDVLMVEKDDAYYLFVEA